MPRLAELPRRGNIIERYAVDEDHWTEGYVTITHEELLREWEQSGGGRCEGGDAD
jgi:hypothetical protein